MKRSNFWLVDDGEKRQGAILPKKTAEIVCLIPEIENRNTSVGSLRRTRIVKCTNPVHTRRGCGPAHHKMRSTVSKTGNVTSW